MMMMCKVLCGPPLLKVTVPLGNLLPDPLELGAIPGSHCVVLVPVLLLRVPAAGQGLLLSEGLAPHQPVVTRGEAAMLLQSSPPPGQGVWRWQHRYKSIKDVFKNIIIKVLKTIVSLLCLIYSKTVQVK